MAGPRRGGDAGFTLAELAIVIAAIAILSLVVLLARGQLQAARHRNAIELVQSLRNAARQHAVRANKGLSFLGINYPTVALPGAPTAPRTPWNSTRVAVRTEGTLAACTGSTCARICIQVPGSLAVPTICNDLSKAVSGAVSVQCSSAGGAASCGFSAGIWTLRVVTR